MPGASNVGKCCCLEMVPLDALSKFQWKSLLNSLTYNALRNSTPMHLSLFSGLKMFCCNETSDISDKVGDLAFTICF